MLVSITTKRQTGESSRLSRLGQESRKSCPQQRPSPGITAATDAIVKITLTTICGTDLQIPKSDFAHLEPGRILGLERVGAVEEVGAAVTKLKSGDGC
jgi:threonine dehydrogenase-like Zn-dependent dehydrogenase